MRRYWDAVQGNGKNSKKPDAVGRSRGADGGGRTTKGNKDSRTA